jgi:hypothetical protein
VDREGHDGGAERYQERNEPPSTHSA